MDQSRALKIAAKTGFFLLLLIVTVPFASAQLIQRRAAQEDNAEDDDSKEEVAGGRAAAVGNDMSLPRMVAAKKFQLNQIFLVEIEALDWICKLTPEQRSKLQVAAKGAAKQLTANWKKTFAQVLGGRGLDAGNADKQKSKEEEEEEEEAVEVKDASEINGIVAQLLGMETDNPFQSRSPQNDKAWTSLVDGILTPEQSKMWREFKANQRRDRRKVIVEGVCSTMSIELTLTSEQIDRFRAMIEPHYEKVKAGSDTFNESFAIYYYASKVSDKQLKSFLSPAQIQRFRLFMLPYREVGPMLEIEE